MEHLGGLLPTTQHWSASVRVLTGRSLSSGANTVCHHRDQAEVCTNTNSFFIQPLPTNRKARKYDHGCMIKPTSLSMSRPAATQRRSYDYLWWNVRNIMTQADIACIAEVVHAKQSIMRRYQSHDLGHHRHNHRSRDVYGWTIFV